MSLALARHARGPEPAAHEVGARVRVLSSPLGHGGRERGIACGLIAAAARRLGLLALASLSAPVAAVAAQPDFSGVWGMVQHDRLGAPFFIPVEPKLNATGKAVTDAFVAKYDVENLEANGSASSPACRR